MEGSLEQMTKRIDDLSKRVEEINSTLSRRIDDINNSLSKRIEDLSKRVDYVNNNLSKRIDALDKRIDALDERIDLVAKISILLAGSVIATLIAQITLAMITRIGVLP